MNQPCVRNLLLASLTLGGASVWAQSSSLYVEPAPAPPPAAPTPTQGVPNRLAPAIAKVSLTAVPIPEPRRFAVQDLVSIIVRESTSSESDAKLETEKETKVNGEVSEWPGLRVFDIFTNQILKKNLDENPKLGLKFKNEFKGEGDKTRRDTFTSRITAKIIDVKPNGTLVLEARKFIQTERETLNMVLTGTCRKEDIAADNTVLSTQMYDLRLTKMHEGDVRDAANKGVLTRVLDFLFNF